MSYAGMALHSHDVLERFLYSRALKHCAAKEAENAMFRMERVWRDASLALRKVFDDIDSAEMLSLYHTPYSSTLTELLSQVPKLVLDEDLPLFQYVPAKQKSALSSFEWTMYKNLLEREILQTLVDFSCNLSFHPLRTHNYLVTATCVYEAIRHAITQYDNLACAFVFRNVHPALPDELREMIKMNMCRE